MHNNILKPFKLEASILLQPEHLSGTKLCKHIKAHAGFQHVQITEDNRVLAFETIWCEFMKYAESCLSKIPKINKEAKFQYMASCDMPIALMPDGSQVICTNTLPQTPANNSFFFIWIDREGVQYV